MEKITPTIILAEINEKIPPPIKFAVKYDPNYSWDFSHFYGMSLAKLCELLEKHGYDLINLVFNNAYAVRRDKNPDLKVLSAEEAYNIFYKNAGWEEHFPYNKNMGSLLEMTPEEGIGFVREFFKDRDENSYELYL